MPPSKLSIPGRQCAKTGKREAEGEGITSRGESAFDENSVTQVSKQSAVTLKNIFMTSLACFLLMICSSRACSVALRSMMSEGAVTVLLGDNVLPLDRRKLRQIGELGEKPR